MSIEFEDSVEDKIIQGLQESKEKAGRDVAERIRFYTYNHLSGKDWGNEIKKTVSSVQYSKNYSQFHVEHPTAYIHEFGGTVQGMKEAEAGDMAFSWDQQQSNKASKAIPTSDNNEVIIVPPKRFLRSAIEKTKKDLQ